MKTVSLLAVGTLLCGLSAWGCGGAGGKALSESECLELGAKIEEVMFAGLAPSELEEVADTPEQEARFVQECMAGENWNRAGYECAMKARSEKDINRCILSSS